ncbi:carnitine O-acetyltransferase, putative, partial [Bodo saltans]
AFQLTYYRLFGRNDATYEAASTRAFLHGRTETVRSVTRAAADFCHVVCSGCSHLFDAQEALRAAAAEHVRLMTAAKHGLGIDRHFFGLERIARRPSKRSFAVKHRVPSLFEDPVFRKQKHWNMSTSHCGSTSLNMFGFGPVVLDGLGLGYMIFNEEIHVVVTCKSQRYVAKHHPRLFHSNRNAAGFATMLKESLHTMKRIIGGDHQGNPIVVKRSSL